MNYISVAEAAKKWNISERSVRNYCAQGRIEGAFVTGKTWNVPADAQKPLRATADLLDVLTHEMQAKIAGGIYHKVQIELTYNSNHIEGSKLTQDETRCIFETNTVGLNGAVRVDDVVETANHFKCVDLILQNAKKPLTEAFVKTLHLSLKNGTTDSREGWFNVGEYKKLPNTVGGRETASPQEVGDKMRNLLASYNAQKVKTFEDVVAFHWNFERIHPFQDGNGRIGRLLLFKECLKHGVVPFIIDEELKLYYYRGLKEWENDRAYLLDTCLAAQDKFKTWLDYFKIKY